MNKDKKEIMKLRNELDDLKEEHKQLRKENRNLKNRQETLENSAINKQEYDSLKHEQNMYLVEVNSLKRKHRIQLKQIRKIIDGEEI